MCVAGAKRRFWVPTWQEEITLAADVPEGASVLPVVNSGYGAMLYPITEARRHLAILAPGHAPSFHRVLAVAGTGDTEDLTITPPAPRQLGRHATFVSFLRLCRLEEDLTDLSWLGPDWAEAGIACRELIQDAPVQAPAPVLSPEPGTYEDDEDLVVTASVADPEGMVRYTLDGTSPTASSPIWPPGGILVTTSASIKVRAYKDGAIPSAVVTGLYALRAATPVVDPPGGAYESPGQHPLEVAITAGTNASILYRLDPLFTNPPLEPTLPYSGPISVTRDERLTVRATRPGIEPSLLVVEDYTWIAGPPLFVPPTGTYSGSVDVTFDLGGNEVAWYTLDGSDPVPGINGIYWYQGGPAIRIEQTTTIKVLSIGGLGPSAIATGVFIIT